MEKKIMNTSTANNITQEIAVQVYGDNGFLVMEIGKRNYTLNVEIVRRYRFDGQAWEQVSSHFDRIK